MNDSLARYRQIDEARRATVLALPTLPFRQHARTAPAPGDVRVSASVGPAGEAVTLWSSAEDLATLTSTKTQAGWATFADPRAARPVNARVTVHAPDLVTTTRIDGLPLAHPYVQPLPEGQVLVVGARCYWRPDGPDRNAIVYDSTGTAVLEQTLGDGIEHVLTTRRGEVWVGYFDEGVYGNYGWGHTNSEPLGSCGLTRFAADLAPAWQYPSHIRDRWGGISDCYALNVDGDTAWTCYYTRFPVVRIDGDTVTGWHNDIGGANTIAVGGSRIALYGGHGPDSDRLVVGVLDDDRLNVTGEYRLVLPDGEPLPPRTRAVGRGPDLHLLAGDDWLRIGIDDIPAEPPR